MTRHVLTAAPSTELAQAMALMVDGRFRHLPVVNEEGHVVGVVSMRDLMAYTSLRLRRGALGERRRSRPGRDDRHHPPHAHRRRLNKRRQAPSCILSATVRSARRRREHGHALAVLR